MHAHFRAMLSFLPVEFDRARYTHYIKGYRMKKQELHPRTEIINKKQKNQAKIARNKALLWLATSFPHAFDNTVLIRPLKLGIMEDILSHTSSAAASGISKSKLREAVVVFTRRIDYLACLKAREIRVDLEGNPVTIVTEDEANYAAAKIKKRVEKSAKNARKNLVNKTPSHSYLKQNDQIKYQAEPGEMHPYPERSPTYSTTVQPARSPVVVTHKPVRTYDPEAVARMKEKLGLSRKRDVEEMT